MPWHEDKEGSPYQDDWHTVDFFEQLAGLSMYIFRYQQVMETITVKRRESIYVILGKAYPRGGAGYYQDMLMAGSKHARLSKKHEANMIHTHRALERLLAVAAKGCEIGEAA